MLNPVPPSGLDEKWAAGDMLSKSDWEIGDGPNHLVYPQWLVPIEETRWAPLTGTFYNLRGTDKVSAELEELAQPDVDPYERTPPRAKPEEGDPIDQLWEIYDQTKVEPDPMKRHKLVWDMIQIHVDEGPFVRAWSRTSRADPGQERPDERAHARGPGAGRVCQSVDPPDAGGVRPGDAGSGTIRTSTSKHSPRGTLRACRTWLVESDASPGKSPGGAKGTTYG